jgi:[ribosomal protein S5]-alanine N-acetyltransferase
MSSSVYVRSPSLDDCEEFIAGMRASHSLHAPWISMPTTLQEYEAYLTHASGERNPFYLACRREDDRVMGFLNISEIIRGRFQSAFLGCGAVAEFAHQGYLTEAMHLVLREAFTRLRLQSRSQYPA